MQITFEVPPGTRCAGFAGNGCQVPAAVRMYTGPKTGFNLCRLCLHHWIESQLETTDPPGLTETLKHYTTVPFGPGLFQNPPKPKAKPRRKKDRHFQGRWFGVIHYHDNSRNTPWDVLGFFKSFKLAEVWLETCREYLRAQPVNILPGSRILPADIMGTLIDCKGPADCPPFESLPGWEDNGKDGLGYG